MRKMISRERAPFPGPYGRRFCARTSLTEGDVPEEGSAAPLPGDVSPTSRFDIMTKGESYNSSPKGSDAYSDASLPGGTPLKYGFTYEGSCGKL